MDFFERFELTPIRTTSLHLDAFTTTGIQVDALRIDEIDPVISGNKWFKLKYHLKEAIAKKHQTICTFGGDWSNHIVATASAAKQLGLKAYGIIRGEKKTRLTTTLSAASALDMELIFVTRSAFKLFQDEPSYILDKIPGAYIIPAGGAGHNGVKGSQEILKHVQSEGYTHIACSIGTGTMFTGLVGSAHSNQTILGIPALKGFHNLSSSYRHCLQDYPATAQWKIFSDYHFGGYGKQTPELITFMNRLFQETGIRTDFVYTGKLFYACTDLATKQIIPFASKLLIIHSGGLQGNMSLPTGLLHF